MPSDRLPWYKRFWRALRRWLRLEPGAPSGQDLTPEVSLPVGGDHDPLPHAAPELQVMTPPPPEESRAPLIEQDATPRAPRERLRHRLQRGFEQWNEARTYLESGPEAFMRWRRASAFRPLVLPCADLRGRTLRDIDWSGCILLRVNFSGADLRGGDFRKAVLHGVVMTDAQLDGIRLEGHEVAVIAGVAWSRERMIAAGLDPLMQWWPKATFEHVLLGPARLSPTGRILQELSLKNTSSFPLRFEISKAGIPSGHRPLMWVAEAGAERRFKLKSPTEVDPTTYGLRIAAFGVNGLEGIELSVRSLPVRLPDCQPLHEPASTTTDAN